MTIKFYWNTRHWTHGISMMHGIHHNIAFTTDHHHNDTIQIWWSTATAIYIFPQHAKEAWKQQRKFRWMRASQQRLLKGHVDIECLYRTSQQQSLCNYYDNCSSMCSYLEQNSEQHCATKQSWPELRTPQTMKVEGIHLRWATEEQSDETTWRSTSGC